MTHITIITTICKSEKTRIIRVRCILAYEVVMENIFLTLIIVVFLFSYLQSQRGQNTSSLSLICSPILGITTPSQLLHQLNIKQCCQHVNVFQQIEVYSETYHLVAGTLVMKFRTFLSPDVVFKTEATLGQIHLHLLSSYD